MSRVRANRVVRLLCCSFVALGVVLIAGSARSDDRVPNADEAAPEYFPPPSAVERRYEAALETPITVTFDETPLPEALETLSELADVPIKFDRVRNPESGEILQPASAVLSGEFNDAPLQAILSRIPFNPDGFDVPATTTMYVAADGILLTIRELAPISGPHSIRRIYPVGDLCASQSASDQLVNLLQFSTGMYWKLTTDDGVGGMIVGGAVYTGDQEDIYEMMPYAGSISYLESVHGLIVQTDPATHAEILQMLRMLRQAKQAATPPAQVTASTESSTPGSGPAIEPVSSLTAPLTR